MAKTTDKYHHGNLRQEVIRVAIQILNDCGVDAITMREIGQQLDVSHSAPYRHFKNKDALLAAIAQSGFERLTQVLKEIREQETIQFDNKFRLMSVEYIKFAINNSAQYRLMYGSEAIERKKFPELQKATIGLAREVFRMIKLCQQRRTLKDVSANQVSQAVWALSHGAAMLVIDGYILVDDLDEFANQMTQHLRSGIEAVEDTK